MRNVEWITIDDVVCLIEELQTEYESDAIHIINFNPIGYVTNLEAVSNFFDDDCLMLGAVICRSIIQGHPLHDGNKRLGMILGAHFLKNNGVSITATDEEYFDITMSLARGECDLNDLYRWLKNKSRKDD